MTRPKPTREILDAMKLPGSDAAGLAGRTIDALHAAGHQALLVGGCVRDLLLGIEPLDFDIATCTRCQTTDGPEGLPIGCDTIPTTVGRTRLPMI